MSVQQLLEGQGCSLVATDKVIALKIVQGEVGIIAYCWCLSKQVRGTLAQHLHNNKLRNLLSHTQVAPATYEGRAQQPAPLPC